MSKILFLLVVILFVCLSGTSQELTNTSLAVMRTEIKQPELHHQLQNAKEDTSKVRLYLFLCSYHWYNNHLSDSITYYAGKARKLSQTLKYNPGFNEASFVLCKNFLHNLQVRQALSLIPEMSKDQQARFLLAVGELYLFLPEQEKSNLDTAFHYFSRALALARSIGHVRMKHECLIALGKYYFSAGQFIRGKGCFLEIISDFQRTGDRSSEAHIWSELGIYMPDTDSTVNDELAAHGTAFEIYMDLKDTGNAVQVLGDMSAVNMYHSNFELARSQMLYAIQLRKAAGIKKLYNCQITVSRISHATGNLDDALYWALEAEKNMKQLDVRPNEAINMLLGMIYGDDGQAEKSLQYLLEITEAHDTWRYMLYARVVEQFIRLKNPQKALLYINKAEKENPAIRPHDRETLAAIKGDIYAAMNNPSLAERFYLKMIQLDKAAQEIKSRQIITFLPGLSGSEAYYKIAKFYESQNRHSIAAIYTNRALQFNTFTGNHFYTSHLMLKIWLLKFKVDSAAGNYISAIQSYENYTALKDSIFNAKRSNQLLQLQVKYDMEKKETDIKTRDQQIQSLTQNDLLRQANLKQAHLIRNITIALLGILLIVGALLYNQYIHKQRSNKLISEKNTQLQHLLSEKEWLLKEVHHRVKNNLHTVVCLLESQAAYLENDARRANEVSQQRIHAMSLIHQKIYQSDDIKTLDMAEYLPELVNYLDDSFGNTRQIHFEVDVDPLNLDISQAIPVALIINEAVTNSIKYAFPGQRDGTISISMHRVADQITLVIADDGIGIDSSLIKISPETLGLQLIKGLSQEINASVNFDNNYGTRITVNFNLNLFNKEDHRLNSMKEFELHI
ncbi:MAG: sensor histidine kinase [Chitinophagaceae bacterium]